MKGHAEERTKLPHTETGTRKNRQHLQFTQHTIITRVHHLHVGLLLTALLVTASCGRLSVKDTLSDIEIELTDQENRRVNFPEDFEGKILLVSYLYTSCPDVCPVTTMRLTQIQKELGKADIQFIGISFDPERDTPERLLAYAQTYKLNQQWTLLTGERKEILKLIERLDIQTLKTPTRFTESGDPIYFIDHTDRVSLVDREGRIRHHYYGSRLDVESVLNDIGRLGES